MAATWLRQACLAVALVSAGLGAAQDYPSKPVKLVVPFPAGGSVDAVARILGQKLSLKLDQQFVIENRPGAGGNIGSDFVAKAPRDGYTLLLAGVSSHAINPSLYAQLPYDSVKDFTSICLVYSLPNVLVVNPSVPAKSVQELVALAKAKPASLTFASSGNGTTLHLSGELFKRMAGVDIVHVPYKGNAPAVTDLIGGQVNLMFDNINNSLPHIKFGKLRALAVTGSIRSKVLPEIPTLAESGFRGFSILSWGGVFGPAGLPKPVIDRLNTAINDALRDKQLRELLASEGIEVQGDTPEEFHAFLLGEISRWSKLVKESGAHID
jgi:tripartite-type tricarboxylate transporter receptor subunit TctC